MDALDSIKPGITMVIMHCTAPTEVFSNISGSGPQKWRPVGYDESSTKNFY